MRRCRYKEYLHQRCRRHLPRPKPSAETRAKISAGLKRMGQHHPELVAERIRAANETKRKRLKTDPEYRARAQEHGRQMGKKHGGRIEGLDYKKVAARSVATRLAHIPLAYRPLYRELAAQRGDTSCRMLAHERAEMVLEQAAIDARRHHAQHQRKDGND